MLIAPSARRALKLSGLLLRDPTRSTFAAIALNCRKILSIRRDIGVRAILTLTFKKGLPFLLNQLETTFAGSILRLHELARKVMKSGRPGSREEVQEVAREFAKAAEHPLFVSISGLYESTAQLSIVLGMLERIKATGLSSEELAILDEVAPKVAQLRAAMDARTEKELKGLS
jgi:hypothetical protein